MKCAHFVIAIASVLSTVGCGDQDSATSSGPPIPAASSGTKPLVDATKLPGAPVSTELMTTASGLQYYDLKVGDGRQPKSTSSTVTVHYTGWLDDGSKFESDVSGEPTSMKLRDFVKGWIEGVGSMRVGGKRKLIIPANLAFGNRGRPGIPGGATVVFDVELLDVED